MPRNWFEEEKKWRGFLGKGEIQISTAPHRRSRMPPERRYHSESAAHFPSDFSSSKRQKLDACSVASRSDSPGMGERRLSVTVTNAGCARTLPHPDLSYFYKFLLRHMRRRSFQNCGTDDDTT
ncbi:hypothetical protein PoB_001255400 [Plakobranchus ocellatus]|uniref:Uncharacterized protein n=1 Tax=Plakobranchus ocellatus TaxID=259542 RepID=A0AAV3YWF4_9GAST|nr:hypothetical protein PoB_001255400 [Plakobranchus ocellatus]